MPSLIPNPYHKSLENDPQLYANLLKIKGIVIGADLGDPIFVKFSLLEIYEGSGYVVFTRLYPSNENLAENLCLESCRNTTDPFEIYLEVEPRVSLQAGERFGQIFFSIEPPLNGPQITGVFVEEEFQKFGISSLAYSFLANHYGVVYSDKNQTIYGARLWYSGLPKIGTVRALDTKANNAIIETFIVNKSPEYQHWDAIKLSSELRNKIPVPINTDSSKQHVVLEFTLNTNINAEDDN